MVTCFNESFRALLINFYWNIYISIPFYSVASVLIFGFYWVSLSWLWSTPWPVCSPGCSSSRYLLPKWTLVHWLPSSSWHQRTFRSTHWKRYSSWGLLYIVTGQCVKGLRYLTITLGGLSALTGMKEMLHHKLNLNWQLISRRPIKGWNTQRNKSPGMAGNIYMYMKSPLELC